MLQQIEIIQYCINVHLGLDATQLCFPISELRKTSATVVQCIHTSAVFGGVTPCLCQDIYFDTIVKFTNCTTLDLNIYGIIGELKIITCYHEFVTDVWLYTLNPATPLYTTDPDHMRIGVFNTEGCDTEYNLFPLQWVLAEHKHTFETNATLISSITSKCIIRNPIS